MKKEIKIKIKHIRMQVKNSYPTVLTDLIGFDPRRLKGLKGDELSRNGPSCLCEIFFFFFSVKQK